MNDKLPFTPHGCYNLLRRLYSLPQPELDAEADVLERQFKEWLVIHFLFSPSQIAYLYGLNDQIIAFTAQASGTALRNRLPIILKKQEKSDFDTALAEDEGIEKEIFKILAVKNELVVTDNEGQVTITGQVLVNIEYLTSSGRR